MPTDRSAAESRGCVAHVWGDGLFATEPCIECGSLPRAAADVRYVTPMRPIQRIKVRVRLLASRVPKVSK